MPYNKIEIDVLESITYQGSGTPDHVRLYASKSFTNGDGQLVVAGRLKSNDFCQKADVTLSHGILQAAAFANDNAVSPTVIDGIDNGTTYTLTLHDANGRQLAVLYSNLKISNLISPTTWAAIEVYSSTPVQPYRFTYPTWERILAYLNSFSPASKMTSLLYGTGKLSRAAVSATDPIVVGDNDYRLTAVKHLKYDYGDNLTTALAAIGATETELRVTTQVSVAATTSIPSNVLVSFDGQGSFTVASGQTLTINSLRAPGNKRIFYGAGSVVLGKNAAPNGEMNLTWWAGLTHTGDLTAIFNQIETSLANNDGGTLRIGPGIWKTSGFDVPSFSTIVGTKNGLDGTSGTILQLADLAGATYIAKVGGNKRNIEFRDICFDQSTSTASPGMLMEAASPNTTTGIRFVNCTFGAGATGAQPCCWIKDAGLTWQCVNVEFDHCVFQVPVNGVGFRCDTVNSQVLMSQPHFVINAGGMGCDFQGIQGTLLNPLFEGNAGYFAATATLDRTITSVTISSGTKTLTVNSGGAFNLNDIGQKIITGGETLYVAGIGADGLTATTEDNAGSTHTAASCAVYQFAPSVSMAYACMRFRGARSVVTIKNSQDEAMAYFIVKEDGQITPINITDSFVQSIIRCDSDAIINSFGNEYYSQLFNTTGTGRVTINSFADRVKNTGAYLKGSPLEGTTLLKPRLIGTINDSTILLNEFSLLDNQLHQNINAPTFFNHGKNWVLTNPDLTNPVVQIGTAMYADAGVSKKQLRIGRLNGVTDEMDFYYDLYRDYDTGLFHFAGNQTSVKGYRFDAGMGYSTGAGGSVTQLTNRSTGVTINAICGTITTNNASLAAGAEVSFTVTNDQVAIGDVPFIVARSGQTAGTSVPFVTAVANGSFQITLSNLHAATADTGAMVINFAIIKAVNS